MNDTTKTNDTPETKPRNLDEILDKMIEAIPYDALNKELVKRRFLKHKNDLMYSAPEMIGYQWRRVSETLEDLFGSREDELTY